MGVRTYNHTVEDKSCDFWNVVVQSSCSEKLGTPVFLVERQLYNTIITSIAKRFVYQPTAPQQNAQVTSARDLLRETRYTQSHSRAAAPE